jgi:hypothetical protein
VPEKSRTGREIHQNPARTAIASNCRPTLSANSGPSIQQQKCDSVLAAQHGPDSGNKLFLQVRMISNVSCGTFDQSEETL